MKYLIALFITLTINANAQSVESLLDSLCTYPNVGKAIYKHESAHGKSSIAKSHNNLFGFKHRVKRNGRYIVVYKKYPSVIDSVIDYAEREKLWIDKYDVKTRTGYIWALSRFYPGRNRAGWRSKIQSMM